MNLISNGYITIKAKVSYRCFAYFLITLFCFACGGQKSKTEPDETLQCEYPCLATETLILNTGENYPINTTASKILSRDMNNDGKLDIVAFTHLDISVVLGLGAAKFNVLDPIKLDGKVNIDFQLTDLNSDSFQDIVVLSDSDLYLYINKGDASFYEPSLIHLWDTDNRGSSLAVADINKDGMMDIAASNSISTILLLGKGDAVFDKTENPNIKGESIQFSDINHDGNVDIVTANSPSDSSHNKFELFLGNGSGAFEFLSKETTNQAIDLHQLTLQDINHDGWDDITIMYDYAIETHINNQDGTFTPAFLLDQVIDGWDISLFYAQSFLYIETDCDNSPDLIMTRSSLADAEIILANGDGTFRDGPLLDTGDGPLPGALAKGDFDSDGDQDMVVMRVDREANQRLLTVYVNDSCGVTAAK